MPIYQQIRELSDSFETQLKRQMDSRVVEMETDNLSHHLIYQVLGVTDAEGTAIDVYQNKGRFLYKYAGSFLEQAARLCFVHKYPESTSTRIPNTLTNKPKTFEIDCLVGSKDAIEIKWRDATTDGDHIAKEHTRLQVIASAGYHPIRVMFYYPNRAKAMSIQKTLETLYRGIGGHYYFGDTAWEFVKDYSGVDLKQILETIGKEKTQNA